MCKYDSLLLVPNFSQHLKSCIIHSKDTLMIKILFNKIS